MGVNEAQSFDVYATPDLDKREGDERREYKLRDISDPQLLFHFVLFFVALGL